MPVLEVARLALLLCELLVDAHRRGLVHLGLCTESILVPQHSGGGPQLFGIGLPKGCDWTQLETYQFLAPEQLSSATCDQRADVYSLGVVMFRCATGQYPVEVAGGVGAAARQTSRRDPRRWLSADAEPLARIIERCIQEDPADRFQTSTALAETIRSSGLLRVEKPRSGNANIILTPPAAQEPEKRAGIDQTTLPPTSVARPLPSSDQPHEMVAGTPGNRDDLVGHKVKDFLIEKPPPRRRRMLRTGGPSDSGVAPAR
jgi:serine/threonine protein kinase